MEALKIVGTAIFSAVTLFLITKIMGHKEVAQLDLFDYISSITIGSIAAEMATDLEAPWKPLVAMAVYGAISISLSLCTSKLPKSRKYINGTPTILLNDGQLYRDNLKKARLDLSEFLMLCRQAGYFQLSDIQTAILECNGKLTVLPVSARRPATPADLGLTPPLDHVDTEVIMDGRVLDENLKRRGLNVQWLQKQLTAQGYTDAKAIFLGLCDSDNHLSLYPMP